MIAKKLAHLLLIGTASVLLAACGNNSNNEESQDHSTFESTYEIEETTSESAEDSSSSVEESSDESETVESTDEEQIEYEETEQIASEQANESVETEDNENPLSGYSNNEIEYARIWLMLGPNQDIDELNVRPIPAGTPVNPNDETSAVYPEDVIQLTGSRLVDGSVTYSSNGDGTINVYDVPTRWETNTPEDLDENYMQELTENIIEDTETVYVDPGNDSEVIELIEIINM